MKNLSREVESARGVAKNAARAVRNCPESLCEEGYKDEVCPGRTYRLAHEHSCHKAWRNAMRGMIAKAVEYKNLTGIEYPNLITGDMLYLGRKEDK
jgi:hypothetical protein